MDDYIPLEEAAARSGLHPNSIRRLLRQRKLRGYKDRGWFWMVSVRSLDDYTHPMRGYLLEMPGPRIFLSRRDGGKETEDE